MKETRREFLRKIATTATLAAAGTIPGDCEDREFELRLSQMDSALRACAQDMMDLSPAFANAAIPIFGKPLYFTIVPATEGAPTRCYYKQGTNGEAAPLPGMQQLLDNCLILEKLCEKHNATHPPAEQKNVDYKWLLERLVQVFSEVSNIPLSLSEAKKEAIGCRFQDVIQDVLRYSTPPRTEAEIERADHDFQRLMREHKDDICMPAESSQPFGHAIKLDFAPKEAFFAHTHYEVEKKTVSLPSEEILKTYAHEGHKSAIEYMLAMHSLLNSPKQQWNLSRIPQIHLTVHNPYVPQPGIYTASLSEPQRMHGGR